MDQWINHFPEMDTAEWRRRFCSEDDRHHVGAFFELYCRALLDGQGFDVMRDPSVPGRRTNPDFLVSVFGRAAFLLECTVASGPHFGGPEQRRISRVYDVLDQVESPDFFLGITIDRAGTKDPPVSRLHAWVMDALATANPDEVSAAVAADGPFAIPSWEWTDSDWSILMRLIPRSSEGRGRPGRRSIGMVSTGALWTDPSKDLFRALKTKASRYGEVALPFVIAVDAMELLADEDIADALFGGRTYLLDVESGKSRERRRRNGLWNWSMGQHRRVSAVLLARSIIPHSVVNREPVLWHNPWAERPLDPELWQGNQMVPDMVYNTMVYRGGRATADILALPAGWPGWEDDLMEDQA